MLEDLRAYIIADATLQNLLGATKTRFYYQRVPPNIKPIVYPLAVFGIVDERVNNTHGADSSELNVDMVQIDIYAESGASVLAVKDALKARLNSANFTQGSTRFGYIEWDGASTAWQVEIEKHNCTVTISVVSSPTA